MERIEYRGVYDKFEWPAGPWLNEPDKIQWFDETAGLPCLIVRGRSGALCGYVGVAPEHPLYGEPYDDVNNLVEVHGGLTFARGCEPDADERMHICHKPSPGEPNHVWWFGFDCAHAGDFSPFYGQDLGQRLPWGVVEYRDIAYVEEECRSLAAQLSRLTEAST